MPIRFTIDGIEYSVETSDELRTVLDVARNRGDGLRTTHVKRGPGRPPKRASTKTGLPWIVQTDTERALWKLLIATPQGVTGKQITETVKIKPTGLQGVMTNMSRRAKKAGVTLDDYIKRDRGEDDSTYWLTDEARQLKPEN